jgi:hypothetical protein
MKKSNFRKGLEKIWEDANHDAYSFFEAIVALHEKEIKKILPEHVSHEGKEKLNRKTVRSSIPPPPPPPPYRRLKEGAEPPIPKSYFGNVI